MATFNKFNAFVEATAEKKLELGADTLKVMLTNTQPVAGNSVKTDITEIGAGNGYTAGGLQMTQVSSSQTGGLYKLVLNDATFQASGGTIGPFQWAVLYDDTATNKDLIGWWAYASAVTLQDQETFKVDADGTTGVLQLE